MTTTSKSPWRLLSRTAVLLLVLTVALPAAASHRFRDVPSSSMYHDATARLDETGITAGCSDTEYCPNQTLTRWQMALFLDRIAGRAAANSSAGRLVAASNGGLGGTPVTVPIRAGGVGSGSGSVSLHGSVTVLSDGDVSSCPCEVEAFVYRLRDNARGPSSWTQLPVSKANGFASVSVPVTWNATISVNTTETFGIGVFVNSGTPTNVRAEAVLTADWAPYRNRR